MAPFRMLTVGLEPDYASYLLGPIATRTGIDFTHGLVGDARRLPFVQRQYPDMRWITLSKAATEPLPAPDYALLDSLESVGVPTVRSMVQGDRILRLRPPQEALGYLTFLARRIGDELDRAKPNVVFASFDSAHSAVSLAVAKARGIPWVALAFTVIPQHLTAFCRGMTPETLVPLTRPVDDSLRQEARSVLERFRSKSVKVFAYRPAATIGQRARQAVSYGRNFATRVTSPAERGIDSFLYPSIGERVGDLARRSLNGMLLPESGMIRTPPATPFAFFPLHMAPESSVDTWAPMYQNQLELAFQLSLALPAGIELVVKLHFSDPDNYSREQLNRLMRLPRVRIAHPEGSSRAFIEQARLVIGIHGTASIEAALLGKPVLLYGDSPYQHFPRSERALRADQVFGQVRRMLEMPAPSDEEIVVAFATYMSRYMPGRLNDWTTPITAEEHDRLAACFDALRSYVKAPGNREGWYQWAR